MVDLHGLAFPESKLYYEASKCDAIETNCSGLVLASKPWVQSVTSDCRCQREAHVTKHFCIKKKIPANRKLPIRNKIRTLSPDVPVVYTEGIF